MGDMTRVAIIGMTTNKGGIESVIMNIYRNIDRSKIQFDFLLRHDSGEMAYEDEVISMGARVYRIIYGERESFTKARTNLSNYFYEHPEVKAVYLHINFPYAFPLKIAKKSGIQVRIIHSHSSAVLFGNEKGIKNKIKAIRNSMVYRQIKRYPNIYFACSELAAQATFKDKDYVWIKNGIELDKFKYDCQMRRQLRYEYGIDEDTTVFGLVGKLYDTKNPLFALEVFKEYAKINSKSKMVIAGDGELRETLRQKVEQYGLKDKVIFLGMTTDAHKWYQAFDLLLMPSLFEGLPVVLVEAQAAGLPCVVSDTITKQVCVTELITYKSNNDKAENWAREIEIILDKKIDRNEYSPKVREAGFEVKSMANEVMKYLLID